MSVSCRALAWLAVAALAGVNLSAQADTVAVQVDPALPWVGFINIYELPTEPGQSVGSYAGGDFLNQDTSRVPAAFVGNRLVLGPNSVYAGGPPGDPFWWQPDGQGGYSANKVLESNFYVDEGFSGIDLSGMRVRFSGFTLTQDLPPGTIAYAWIRDFSPGYAEQRNAASVLLDAGQAFSVSLDTSADGLVQYGFAVLGRNADPGLLNAADTVTVSAVPEPASVALLLAGALAVAAITRRRRAG